MVHPIRIEEILIVKTLLVEMPNAEGMASGLESAIDSDMPDSGMGGIVSGAGCSNSRVTVMLPRPNCRLAKSLFVADRRSGSMKFDTAPFVGIKPVRLNRSALAKFTIPLLAAIFLILGWSTLAVAESQLAGCFRAAASRYHLNPLLLYSIALQESRLNFHALNLNGDGTTDIGIMQVNSRWLPQLATYGISREMLFDPCTNISVGAWALASEFYDHGANWSSVGRYNSPDAGIGAAYAAKVRTVFNEARASAAP